MNAENPTPSELLAELAELRQRLIDLEALAALQKGAEHALRQSLQTAADIVMAIPSGLFIYQFEPPDRLVLLEANPEAERLTGIKLAEWRGAEFNEIWPQAAKLGITKAFLSPIRSGQVYDSENVSYRDDRMQGNYRVRVFPMPGERLGVAFEDITKLRESRAELRKSKERFRALFEQAAVGVAQIETHSGRFISVNQCYCNIVGYSAQEMQTLDFQTITHPDDLQEDLANMERLKCGEISQFSMEKRYIRKDGSLVWVNLTVSPMWPPGAAPDYHIAVVEDIGARKQAEAAIIESEERFQALVEKGFDGVFIHRDFIVLEANQQMADILGRERQSLIGDQSLVWATPDSQASISEYVRSNEGHVFEADFIRMDGSIIQAEVFGVACCYQGRPARIVGVRDVTKNRQAQAALKESEEKFRIIAQKSLQGIVITTQTGLAYANPVFEELFGYTLEELNNLPVQEQAARTHPEDADRVATYHQNLLAGNTVPIRFEYRIICKDGAMRWVETRSAVIDYLGRPALLSVFVDISERKQVEQELRQSEAAVRRALEEKTALLKELNHRTKNNLQVIVALLDLQSRTLDDPLAKTALAETGERIQSMALVHEKLYKAGDLAHINLAGYIQELTGLLMQSHARSSAGVDLALDLEDVYVQVDTAIPCGLILNELVSNALKHAFPENRPGQISVRLRRLGSDLVVLRVADNGVGLPLGFDPHTDGSLGIKIIMILAERQLHGGQVEYMTGSGVACEVRFNPTA